MTRKVIIHIGVHKTGSTSIQTSLRLSEDLLADQNWLLPDLHLGKDRRQHSHQSLPSEMTAMAGGEPMGRTWRALSDILRERGENIILSSELFCSRMVDPGFVECLLGFFRERDFEVVFVSVVRDQPDWLNSLYSQLVKRIMFAGSFEEFVETALDRPLHDMMLLHENLLHRTDSTLIVVPFKGDIVRGFLSAIGIDFSEWPVEALDVHSNSNPGTRILDLCLQFARTLAARKAQPARDFPFLNKNDKAMNASRAMRRELEWPADRYSGLDDDIAARIRARFKPTNDEFALTVWGQHWEEIFPPKHYEKHEFVMDEATPEIRAEHEQANTRIMEILRLVRQGKMREVNGFDDDDD